MDILDHFGETLEVYDIKPVELDSVSGFELFRGQYKSRYSGNKCEMELIKKDGKMWDAKYDMFDHIIKIDELLKTNNQVVIYDSLERIPQLYKISHVDAWLFDTIRKMDEAQVETFKEESEYFWDYYYAGNDYVRLAELDKLKTFKI